MRACLALCWFSWACGGAPRGALPDGALPDALAPDAARPPGPATISDRYPGDVGIAGDSEVVFAENFEEGSVAAVTARYSDSKPGGLSLDTDVPPGSRGTASMRMYADPSAPAADLYQNLGAGYDELYVRYYVKYQAGIKWHHSSFWVGGYDPPSPWPNPQAGTRPLGNDRLSISFEPVGADGSPAPQLDFYDYWMTMHSWTNPPGGPSGYYGNTLLHRRDVRVADDTWRCFELHVKLNTDPASTVGAVLEVFIDDALVARYDQALPLGYWIRDKFCPTWADSPECTNYPPPSGTTLIPLDLQLRSTTNLKLNALWPQNYITAGPGGSVKYDDIVAAKSRVGCLR